MVSTTASSHRVVHEHEVIGGLDQPEREDLERFALANLVEDDQGHARPVLALRNGQLHARSHVGTIETRRNAVVEILPKVEFAAGDAETRRVFLAMLRSYRAMRFADFNQTSIDALRDFPTLTVFVRLFLDELLRLTKRGLARGYHGVEDNVPCLRGRILFPQHIRLNAANGTRFYVGFDEFTANRPVNRLIHTTIHRLRTAADPDHRQLLHQLRICFAEVPRSEHPKVDWQKHRIDRSMRHYERVMAWVGLFLFNHGLATFRGDHVNRALLFAMEEVFEDYVVDAFRRYQQRYGVQTQGPQEALARRGRAGAFTVKPDIALMRGNGVRFVLDAKWKRLGDTGDVQRDIAQSDVYQLYSYGRKFGCKTVALLYPKTAQFSRPLRYEFNDAVVGQPLSLWCFPFDVVEPQRSVEIVMAHLEPAAKAVPE